MQSKAEAANEARAAVREEISQALSAYLQTDEEDHSLSGFATFAKTYKPASVAADG